MIPRSLRTFCPSRFPIKPRYKLSFRQKCWFPLFRKTYEFGKYKTLIWLRNLSLRTAVSRPSPRTSMYASISSPKNNKFESPTSQPQKQPKGTSSDNCFYCCHCFYLHLTVVLIFLFFSFVQSRTSEIQRLLLLQQHSQKLHCQVHFISPPRFILSFIMMSINPFFIYFNIS